MSPRKRSQSKPKKAKSAKKAVRRVKQVRAKKPASKKPAAKAAKKVARKRPRPAIAKASGRTGSKRSKGEEVDKLGDWQHEHHGEEPHTGEFTEDDIPPDYGGSE